MIGTWDNLAQLVENCGTVGFLIDDNEDGVVACYSAQNRVNLGIVDIISDVCGMTRGGTYHGYITTEFHGERTELVHTLHSDVSVADTLETSLLWQHKDQFAPLVMSFGDA